METALSIISTLPSSKEQSQMFFRNIKNEILANDKDPLRILSQLKFIEKLIKDILQDEDLDYHFLKEFDLFSGEGIIKKYGCEFRSGEVGSRYHYEESGDPKWNDLQKQKKELDDKIKEREKFLQNIPYDAGIVDSDTGVFITKPPKTSHTKVITKLI